MRKLIFAVAALACLGVAACSDPGGALSPAAGGVVGALEVPVVAAVETRFAVVCDSVASDAQPRSIDELRSASVQLDRERLALIGARGAYDAGTIVRPAAAGTAHLVAELRAASDTAYTRAKARLAERIAEGQAVPTQAPI